MAHRDHDEQPQAADLGAAVQLDNAETLEGPPGAGDALDAGYVPPDRPYALDEDAMTGAGMREGDSVDQRLRRERPDELPADAERAGRLVAGDAGEGVTDVGVDGGAASAEEAAVHEITADTRAETEPSLGRVRALADPEADAEIAEADAAGARARGDAMRDAADLDAADIDGVADASGAAAAASGRDDVGPGSGL
jgi:hypothetical protein